MRAVQLRTMGAPLMLTELSPRALGPHDIVPQGCGRAHSMTARAVLAPMIEINAATAASAIIHPANKGAQP